MKEEEKEAEGWEREPIRFGHLLPLASIVQPPLPLSLPFLFPSLSAVGRDADAG
jgi:hypothetical protein